MGYIYRIWNDINNKVYIGKTLSTIEVRWKEHLSGMNKRKNEKRPLYSAMRKYGTSHFHIEMVEECSDKEINEKEIYWIKYYNSYYEGYNATKGGDGKAYVDVNLILQLWEEGKNNKEIHNVTGYSTKTITKHLKDNGISEEEREKRGREKKSKTIAMLDKTSNEILKIFSSAREAEKYLNKKSGHWHILEVCSGKRKTAYGYKWKFFN